MIKGRGGSGIPLLTPKRGGAFKVGLSPPFLNVQVNTRV